MIENADDEVQPVGFVNGQDLEQMQQYGGACLLLDHQQDGGYVPLYTGPMVKLPQVEPFSERWYGSGKEHGWWLVRGREHVAHLGPDINSHAVTRLLDALNLLWPRWLPAAPAPLPARLVKAVREVLRISDRQHVAWDEAKAALAEFEAGQPAAQNQAPAEGYGPTVEEQRELLTRLRYYGDNDRDAACALIERLGADLYAAEGRANSLAQKLAEAQECVGGWVTFGGNVTDALGLRVMYPKQILAEIARLRAAQAAQVPLTDAARDVLKQIDAALQGTLANATDMRDMAEDVDAAQQIARAALGAQPPVTHGWQPIETALKDDGRPVLLLVNGEVLPGCWCHVPFKEVRDLDGRYVDQRDEEAFWMTYRDGSCEPTHWMPLPAAPGSNVQHKGTASAAQGEQAIELVRKFVTYHYTDEPDHEPLIEAAWRILQCDSAQTLARSDELNEKAGMPHSQALELAISEGCAAHVQPKHTPTPVDINAQDWAGMDGATAYQLIERHGEDWSHIGRLMAAWLAANTTQAHTPAPEPASARERWNIERDGDALLVCFNDHEKGQGCRFERFVPESTQAPAPAPVAFVDPAALEWLASRQTHTNAFIQTRLYLRENAEQGATAAVFASPAVVHTEALALLRELHECGAVTNWLRVSDDLRQRVDAALRDASAHEKAHREPLTDAQIEAGREATFSTSNPFCPCDSKTMRKAVRWAEHAHGIGKAQPPVQEPIGGAE